MVVLAVVVAVLAGWLLLGAVVVLLAVWLLLVADWRWRGGAVGCGSFL